MPVSAALLVTGGAGGSGGAGSNGAAPSAPSSHHHQFVRGEKATSSVKLRRRNKDDPSNYEAMNASRANNNNNKKNHRHSCDFSVLNNDRSQSVNYLHHHNDFDYITFGANGVPIVHGVCVSGMEDGVNGGGDIISNNSDVLTSMQPVQMRHQVSAGGGLNNRRQRTTTSVVHITRRESPHQHLKYSRPVSSSAMNIHRGGVDPIRQSVGANYVHMRGSPSHSPSKQLISPVRPARLHNNLPVQMRQSPSSHFLLSSTKDSVSPLRRQSEALLASIPGQVPARGAAKNKSDKSASNEFEFKMASDSEDLDKQAFLQLMKHGILRSGDSKAGSQESGIFSTGSSQESPTKAVAATRQPGLGRRAITQLNLRENKHHSRQGLFNEDLARSQENIRAIVGQESNSLHVDGGSGATDDLETSIDHSSTIKKGLLWQQRDKLFSSWKERYFILTQHFLQCFKKETSRITDMGGFLFKIKLAEIESVDLLDKKGYLTICMNFAKEPKMFLRKTEGIRDWYNLISSCVKESKSRKLARTNGHISLEPKQATDSSGIESYVFNKRRLNFRRSDSTPEIHKNDANKERITLDELSNLYKNEEEAEKRKQEVIRRKRMNRLSLMTDMELLPDISRVPINRDIELKQQRNEADSGHNSLNTNRSSGSTISSKHSMGPIESHFPEMEEEEEETMTQTPVSSPPGDGAPKSLCETGALHNNKIAVDGPRSLAVGGGVSSIQEEDVTISCSMPSPKITICNPQENKNVIEVRYRERSSPRSTTGGAKCRTSAIHHRQQSAPSPREKPPTTSPPAAGAATSHVNRLQITHV